MKIDLLCGNISDVLTSSDWCILIISIIIKSSSVQQLLSSRNVYFQPWCHREEKKKEEEVNMWKIFVGSQLEVFGVLSLGQRVKVIFSVPHKWK